LSTSVTGTCATVDQPTSWKMVHDVGHTTNWTHHEREEVLVQRISAGGTPEGFLIWWERGERDHRSVDTRIGYGTNKTRTTPPSYRRFTSTLRRHQTRMQDNMRDAADEAGNDTRNNRCTERMRDAHDLSSLSAPPRCQRAPTRPRRQR
jgi:hypothetical protein